jgi:hypothetical protein
MGQGSPHSALYVIASLLASAGSLALTACSVPTPTDIVQSSVFARPGIVYQSGDNIGVDYNAGGIMNATNEREAVALIEKHCKGRYHVVRRGGGHIDAVCDH